MRSGSAPSREDLAVSIGTVGVVYECPSCEERLMERRCPECNVFCRRLASGGHCPGCGEVILVDELEEGL